MAEGREIAAAYIALVPSARGIKSNLEKELQGPAEKAGKEAGQAIEDGITTGAQSASRKAAGLLASGVLSAAIVTGLNRAKDAASGLQQAVGGTEAVFAEAAGTIDAFADRSAEAVGLSARSAREFTAQIGAALQGYGYSVDQAAEKSIELTTLGADLAATFGGTVPEAVTALSAALRGEFDPLERYGVALRASEINARAVKDGLAASETSVSSYAKAQSTLAIILEQTAAVQGQFGRESETASGQAQIAAAKTEDAAANLGESLLPLYAKVAEGVGQVADVFASLPDGVQTGILALGGIVAIAGPVSQTVDLFRTLRPQAVGAAMAVAEVGTSASNSASSVDDLYSGTRKAGGAMRTLATAGGVLAAVGIAATLYEMAAAATEVSVDVEEAARATTEELVAGFQEIEAVFGSGAVEEAFSELVDGGDAGAAAAVELRDALAATGQDVSALDEILADAAVGEEIFAQRANDGADALGRYGTEAPQAADALGEVAEEALTAEEVLADLNDRLDDGIDLFRDYFNSASSDEESMIRFRDALRDMAGLQDEVNAGQLVGQERVDEFTTRILKGRDAILEMAEGMVRSGVPLDEVVARVQALTDELFAGADQAGLTKTEVANLREELGLMPGDIEVAVNTNLAQVTEDQKQFNAAIYAAMLLSETIRQNINKGRNEIFEGKLLEGRASGGATRKGQSYVIGEEGVPEIWTAGADGFVTPMDVFWDGAVAPTSAEAGGPTLVVQQHPGEDQVSAGMRALRWHQQTRQMAAAR